MPIEGRTHDEMKPPSGEEYRLASINDRDDLESAVQWILLGRVDTKGFAKHLPHTAQDLIDGNVTPEQVADDLESVYDVRTVRLRDVDVETCPFTMMAILTSMCAIPREFRTFCRPKTDFEELCVLFGHDLDTHLSERWLELAQKDLTTENASLLLKQALDYTCEQWSGRLDKELFRGKHGSFLKKCPLYNVPAHTFLEPDMPLRRFVDNLDVAHAERKKEMTEYRKVSLLSAAQNVARGYHDIKRACWECGSVSELKYCSNCNAAGYCSEECQVAAWRGGHKQKCDALKSRYSEFLPSLHCVDDAHKAGAPPIIDGLLLSDELDYMILGNTFAMESPYAYAGTSRENQQPSMKNFYDNLGRVFRGEWWFYEDADRVAYQEAVSSHDDEVNYFMMLCLFMSYDYHLAEGYIPEFTDSSFVMCARDNFGAAMPAACFIEMYASGRATEDSVDRFRLRRETRNDCIREFIESFHK